MAGQSIEHKPLGYAAELDGIRAIAVAAVLLFHLRSPWFPGGFVGVDVFFVLSGFLITRLILTGIADGTFRLTDFYLRRIRRIIPAFVFVALITSLAAWFVLLPREFETYAKTLIAAATSTSNIWFYLNSGYFDPAAETQPLLHTWSLGIEEQFYLIFPLILILAAKRHQSRATIAILSLWLVSFLASCVLVFSDKSSAFYLLHARAWELLCGSILAAGIAPQITTRRSAEVFGWAGLLLVLGSVFGFSAAMPFPGPSALLPCVGTMLLISIRGSDSTIAGVLRSSPFVGVGLISYSLYLWHWPVIVFARLLDPQDFSLAVKLAITATSLIAAALSWRYVETPFRSSSWNKKSAYTVGLLGAGALSGLVAFGLLVVSANGVPQRFSPSVLSLAAASSDSSPMRERCHFNGQNKGSFEKSCILGADVPPTAIVYGDSHGAELSFALGELAKERKQSIRQITASACPPVANYLDGGTSECARYNASILTDLSKTPPTKIILAAYGFLWMKVDTEDFWQGLRTTIKTLRDAGHEVYLMADVPSHPHRVGVPEFLARRAAVGLPTEGYRFDPGLTRLAQLSARLADLAQETGARQLAVSRQLCDNNGCKAMLDGAIAYWDDNHLSVAAAKILAQREIIPVLWPSRSAAALSLSR